MNRGGAAGANPPARFVALDSLRGIVALIVAAHHLNARTPLFGLPFFQAGVQCVDFFFVLSGFVIAASYGERLQAGYPPTRFLWLRLGRIYPAHQLMVLCYVLIELWVALSGAADLTGRAAFTGPRDLAYLPAALLLMQSLWPAATMTWNVQSWSISVELILYLLVAFGWSRLGRGWWLAGFTVALVAGWMVDHALLAEGEKLLRGLCGFGSGLALWKLWELWGTRLLQLRAHWMTLAEVGTLLLSGWIFVLSCQQPPILAADAVFGLTVLVFAAQRGQISHLLFTAPFVLAGAISYSVYMVHGLVETASLRIVQHLLAVTGQPSLFTADAVTARPVPNGDWRADLIGALALMLVFAAAWVLFRWFEWPLREWSRRRAHLIGKTSDGPRM